MTHGLTPTRRCGPTRAVRLALEEIGPLGAPPPRVYAVAITHAPGLSPEQFERVVEDGTDGRLKKGGWIERLEVGFLRLRAAPRLERWMRTAIEEQAREQRGEI